MTFAWKAAGLTYNRYLSVAAQAVRRSLKPELRVKAESQAPAELKYAHWKNGKQGEVVDLAAQLNQDANQIPLFLAYCDDGHSAECLISFSAWAFISNRYELALFAPPPNIRSTTTTSDSFEGMNYDITEKFTSAASALVTGELVKDEYFTLFEAVGALEIMDSKMDSGYLAPGETPDHNYDVMRALLPEEVLGIMDQLLCHEVAWHMGHPLSQTLFTSIYLDRLLWPVPNSLEDARFNNNRTAPAPANGDENKVGGLVNIVLRAYCLALIKACSYVHERIASEFYYEEEDFSTQLYGRKLLPGVKPEEIVAVLDNAIEWLNSETKDIDETVKRALLDRLTFRRHFLDSLAMDLALVQSRSTKSLCSTLDQITLIQKSLPLGKPVEDAFSEKIQRRLASTVPPRPIIKIESQSAILYLKRFCQDAIDLQEILDSCSAFSLYNLLWTLQSRKPQPSVYIRSLAQAVLLLDAQILGILPAEKFCCGSMKDLVLPCSPIFDPKNEEVEVPTSPKFQIAKQMDTFIQRMSQ
ncbi:hypothetical protein FQN49_007701, partial [Arthroderma sp. PD_2]